MRPFFVVYFIFLLSCFSLKAQSAKDFYDIDSYLHTISSAAGKITFYTIPLGKFPGKMELNKTYFWYSNNSLSSTQGGYSGKFLHGLYSSFYLNKSLKEQGRFHIGLKEGIWKSWSEVGLLTEVMEYKKGLLDGKFFSYKPSGILSQEGRYRKGKLHGKLKSFSGNDSARITMYKNGKPVPKVTVVKKRNLIDRLLFRKSKDPFPTEKLVNEKK